MMFQKGVRHKHRVGGSKKRKYRNGAIKDMEPPAKYQSGFINRMDFRTEIYMNLSLSYDTVIADLGGRRSLSRIELSLVERYIFAEYKIREIEVSADNGMDTEQWLKWNNVLNSIAAKLGVQRRKPKNSELREYIEAKTE